jgi:Leucine-rich repeat (LRR) protein
MQNAYKRHKSCPIGLEIPAQLSRSRIWYQLFTSDGTCSGLYSNEEVDAGLLGVLVNIGKGITKPNSACTRDQGVRVITLPEFVTSSVFRVLVFALAKQQPRVLGTGYGKESLLFDGWDTADVYSLHAFAHEFDIQWLSNSISKWLLGKGVDWLTLNPPGDKIFALIGQELSLVVKNKHLIAWLQKQQYHWLQRVCCYSLDFSSCSHTTLHTLLIAVIEYNDMLLVNSGTGIKKLKFVQLKDVDCTLIANLTAIQTLDVSWCNTITDAGITDLARLGTLSSLNLNKCNGITDIGVAELARLPLLQNCNLSGCTKITNAALGMLVASQTLQTLDLSGCNNITDAGLAFLAKLPALKTLKLFRCAGVTDTGLGSLASSPSLEELGLCSCTRITDTGLDYLSRTSSLQALQLSGCTNITAVGLAGLAPLPSLRTLVVSRYNLAVDVGLSALAKLPSLQNLDLSWCRTITDSNIYGLSQLRTLQNLDLSGCANITQTGLDALERVLPLHTLNLSPNYTMNSIGEFRGKHHIRN